MFRRQVTPLGDEDQKNPALTEDCSECEVLRNAMLAAVRNLVQLHELHAMAIIQDDSDPHRFDILIHEANERRQNAKYAYILHRENHVRMARAGSIGLN